MASFLLGLLLQAGFLPPANKTESSLGFRNGVPTVANRAMLHLLVMIKLLLGTFLLWIWLSGAPREMSNSITEPWDQSIHAQVNESRPVTEVCPLKYGSPCLWKLQTPLSIIPYRFSIADACQLICNLNPLTLGKRWSKSAIKPAVAWQCPWMWYSSSKNVWNSVEFLMNM